MQNAKKILLVEDDPGLLRIRSIALRAAGHQVLAAPSPEAALRTFDEHRDIALVLTDQEHGTALNGIGLLKAMHERGFDGPGIVSSGNLDQEDLRRQAAAISAKIRLMPKGANPSALKQMVGELLGEPQVQRS